jgi:membrane fusion protein, type I secretion system
MQKNRVVRLGAGDGDAPPAAVLIQRPELEPDESFARYARMGWIVIGIFFGGFGLWSVTAPLNGAVIANAVVKVDGNRKSVEHLQGGIVKALKVKEGDHVKAGDVLIVLDDSQARADFEVLDQQQALLAATLARLTAELRRTPVLTPPASIAARSGEPQLKAIWDNQVKQFESRRADLEGQRKVIEDKIGQLKEQIAGDQQQVDAYTAQLTSVRNELDNITPLVTRGLIAQPRRLQLERAAYGLEGQIAQAGADAGRAEQAIAEQTQQIAQLENDRLTEVTKDLHDTQSQLLDVTPKLTNAKAELARMDIRAPYSGKIVGLSVFGIGAVIQRGEKIMDIVPDDDALTIEAQIAVDDISDVHPDMRAEINLTAYKQRITPMVHGDVTQVSADRLTDQRTGAAYYTAEIHVDGKELAKLPNVKLYPGMPARIMIPTVERTAFDYLIGPLAMSFNSAFRQR